MAMLRRLSTAALGIPTDLSAEAVDVVTAAPRPAGTMTTSAIESRLPIATSSSNSYKEEGSGRLSQRVALIDPKPLTRRSIADLLAKAFPKLQWSRLPRAKNCSKSMRDGSADRIWLSYTSEIWG
jgi:hypothetical protein